MLGLVLFGFGLALLIAADPGLPPWDVLHQGIANRSPLTIGVVGIGVGILLLGVMAALKEPIAIGTIANIVVIGLVIDGTLLWLDTPSAMAGRVAFMLAGPAFVALGSGFYIGARLGSGPRDGIMTALERRGVQVWKARTGIELTVFIAGFALGGSVGLGTIWFLVSIGPMVEFWLVRLRMAERDGLERAIVV